MKYGHKPFGPSKHSQKMFTYTLSLCPLLVELGSPKHRVTEGLANLVQVHCYREDC